MRMAALMEVMREDKALKSVYLIGQDYSFGQAVLREAKKQLAAQRRMWPWWATSCTPWAASRTLRPTPSRSSSSGAGGDHRQLGQ
jgi:branched-chain amino acid transport system substrate-binding protein